MTVDVTADVTADIGADLVDLSSILSIALSVKQLGSEDGISYDEALRICEEKADPNQKMLLAQKGAKDVVVKELIYIDDILLDELHSQAKRCVIAQAKALKSAGSNAAKRIMANEDARKCMCLRLIEVMGHNRGRLPDKYNFHRWWKSYGCDTELKKRLKIISN